MKILGWMERGFWVLIVLSCYAVLGVYAAEHAAIGLLKQLSNPLHCSLWQVVAGAVFLLPMAIISIARPAEAKPLTAGLLVLVAVAIGCTLGTIGAILSARVWLWILAAVGCGILSTLLYVVWCKTKAPLVRIVLVAGFMTVAGGGLFAGWMLGDNSLIRWQVDIQRKDNVAGVAFIPESPCVYIQTRQGETRVYNYMTGEAAPGKEYGRKALAQGLSEIFGPSGASGRESVKIGRGRHEVDIVNRDTNDVLLHVDLDKEQARAVARSSDGTRLAIGSYKGKIYIWDVPEKRKLRTLQLPGGTMAVAHRLEFTSDRNRLISNYYQDEAAIWDIDSGKIVRKFHGHSSGPWSFAVSPDGKYFVTADRDGVIRCWNLR